LKIEEKELNRMSKKSQMSDYWNMGTAIGLCAAVGIVLGALLSNVLLWLCIGAGVGAVLGAVTRKNNKKK
jgi:uncharacterized membrane protein